MDKLQSNQSVKRDILLSSKTEPFEATHNILRDLGSCINFQRLSTCKNVGEINFRVLTQRTTAHNHDLKNANKILAANLEKPIEGNNQKQPNIQWLSNIYQYLIYTIIKFYLILVCLLVEKHDNNNFLKDFLHIFPSG